MTVIMERDPSASVPVDYRVIAMRYADTAARELQAAGAEGFRIALVPQSTAEGVFVLQRSPGQSERFTYIVGRLKEENPNELLARAEAEGFRVVLLFSDLVVLERAVVAAR